MKLLTICAAATPALTSLLLAGAAHADDVDRPVTNFSARAPSATVLPNAQPMVNPLPPPQESQIRVLAASPSAGAGPGVKPGRDAQPASPPARGRQAFGSFGIPYASTRVQLGWSGQTIGTLGPAYLSSTQPYSMVGKLFFNGSFCSASLIRRSVIVTAAHCIQRLGSGGATFGGWTYVPGHYGPTGATATQRTPYGSFNWAGVLAPASWSNGTDIGSGSARDNDIAVIALAPDANGRFVGDLTGWLTYGWNNYSFVSSARTGNLSVAATSTLGYPGLMDAGAIMQRADGPSYLTSVAGAGQIWQGNNFTGGSSGGPWIVNFVTVNPNLSGGAVIGGASVRAVVGVTSWGSRDPNGPKDNYASQFRQNNRYPNAAYGVYGAGNIGSLLNTLCGTGIGKGQTFASVGYCD